MAKSHVYQRLHDVLWITPLHCTQNFRFTGCDDVMLKLTPVDTSMALRVSFVSRRSIIRQFSTLKIPFFNLRQCTHAPKRTLAHPVY